MPKSFQLIPICPKSHPNQYKGRSVKGIKSVFFCFREYAGSKSVIFLLHGSVPEAKVSLCVCRGVCRKQNCHLFVSGSMSEGKTVIFLLQGVCREQKCHFFLAGSMPEGKSVTFCLQSSRGGAQNSMSHPAEGPKTV
jgi:hypothetical protein